MLIDIAGERAVLSGLYRYGVDLLLDISDVTSTSCFTNEINQCLWVCFSDILSKSSRVDIPSILSKASELGFSHQFEQGTGLKYLKNISEFPVTQENATLIAKKLARLHIARQGQERLLRIHEDLSKITGDESIDDILGRIETPVINFTNELVAESENRPKLLFEHAEEYVQHLIDNPVNQLGLSLGWPKLDKCIGGGCRNGSIFCLATRTSTGKSHFCKSVAIHNAKQGIPVLYLDTEMMDTDVINRSLASMTRVTINEIESGKFGFDEDNKRNIITAARHAKKLPIYYQTIGGQGFDGIIGTCRRWILKEVGRDENGKTKPCMVIIDYLKMMDTAGLQNMQEYQLMGEYLHALHDLAVKMAIPIVTAIQLNRSGITTEDLSAISSSDRISWLCSNMVLMRELTPDEIEEVGHAGNIKVMPLKTRFGTDLAAGDWLIFKREGQYSLFTEVCKRSEVKVEEFDEHKDTDTEEF